MTDRAAVIEASSDPAELMREALREGWGDGLPVIPPTRALVDEFVAASGRDATEVLGLLPPSKLECTVELTAVNAVLAGAPAAAMPLICASLLAMLDPALDLAGINATTAAVVPAVVVNGPVRDELGIPYQYSALGGAASSAPAIGRAIRLVMRNVGGLVPGVTSESVFGQPARVVGIVVGEWEERSPWKPLSERRGVAGSAVTVFGALGTANILDAEAESGVEVLQVIGKSLAYMGNNKFTIGTMYSDQMIGINPVWANEVIARDVPSIEDVQEIVWRSARLPVTWFPDNLRRLIERERPERIDADGNVMLMASPDELQIFVAGGLGSLHAVMLPGFSNSVAVTRGLAG